MSELQALIQDYGLNGIGEGPIYNVQDVTISRELDGAGSFQFQAPLADERVNDLAANERRAVIYVYHPNGTSREIGSGVIRSKAESGDNWAVSGPDLLAELANENTLINRVYDGVALTTVLSELIALVRSNRNLCMGGTATASSSLTIYVAANAFDRDSDTYWRTPLSGGIPATLEYQFTTAYTIRRYALTIPAQSLCPVSWTLEYYDGATWQVADTQKNQFGWLVGETKLYDVADIGTTAARWRINITECGPSNNATGIAEFRMSPLTDWTIDTTGVTGDFYGAFDGVSILKALQVIAAASGYHFRVEANRNIVFGPLGDAADLTIIQAGTLTDTLEDNNEIAILDQPLRQLTSEQITNWVLPLGQGTPPLTLENLQHTALGSVATEYDETNRNAWFELRGTGTDYDRFSQSFQIAANGVIYAVALYLKSNGTPIGDAYVSVHNATADTPTSGISGRPATKTESDISASGEWVFFWLERAFDGVAGSSYAIQLATSRTSADASNNIAWGADTSAPSYANGQGLRRTPAGSWGVSSADMIFKVYAAPAGETVYTPHTIIGPDGSTLYYLSDDPSIGTYGKVAQVLTIDVEAQGSELADLQNASLLIWRAANAWLSKRVDPQTYYSASIRKGYSTIYPGQLIRLVYNGDVYDENGDKITWADVDDTFWVIRVSETVSANGDLIAQLDLSTIAQSKEDAASRIVSAVESFTVEGIRRFYGPSILDEQSGTVFSPPSGKWSVYPKSDGLYIKDDAGTETRLLGTTDLTSMVLKSLFDANTILAANSDDTPAALTVAEQTLIGRITAGNIDDLSVAQVRTLLALDRHPVRVSSNSGLTMTNDAYTTVIFEDEDSDAESLYNNTTGIFTCPQTGDWRIDASVLFAPTTTWAAGELIRMRINVNSGSTYYYLDNKANEGNTDHAVGIGGGRPIPLTATNTVQIEVYQKSGGDLPLTTAAGFNWLTIDKLPG